MNNSFHINLRGPRAEVIAALKTAVAEPPGSDQSQVESVKTCLLSGIDHLPAEFSGVRIVATGELHETGGEIRINLGGLDRVNKPGAPASPVKPKTS